jgi:N,N'-diacetyllegionaminate synthase
MSSNAACFFIAEAGVNHNGSIELAKKLVHTAHAAGADAVKFQTFNTQKLVTPRAKKADYQLESTGTSQTTQDSMLKALELSEQDHIELKALCDSLGIEFMSTGFDLDSLDFLVKKIGIKRIKIPSGEITNGLLIERAASFNLPIILSTGMSTLAEIQSALDLIQSVQSQKSIVGSKMPSITVLHCVSEYPAPLPEIHLRALEVIRESFPKVEIGYSDHTLGNACSTAAYALGATVIEKHFTLDTSLEGPDHKASSTPEQLADLIQMIRDLEKALGNRIKQPGPSELNNRTSIRKSLVYASHLKEGTTLGLEHLDAKRPGDGLSPMNFRALIGKKLRKSVLQDELIQQDHFESE